MRQLIAFLRKILTTYRDELTFKPFDPDDAEAADREAEAIGERAW